VIHPLILHIDIEIVIVSRPVGVVGVVHRDQITLQSFFKDPMNIMIIDIIPENHVPQTNRTTLTFVHLNTLQVRPPMCIGVPPEMARGRDRERGGIDMTELGTEQDLTTFATLLDQTRVVVPAWKLVTVIVFHYIR